MLPEGGAVESYIRELEVNCVPILLLFHRRLVFFLQGYMVVFEMTSYLTEK